MSAFFKIFKESREFFMLAGILFQITAGIVWIGAGAVISHAAKKGLSLDFIQGMSALIIMVLTLPVFFFSNIKFHALSLGALVLSGVVNYICFITAQKAMAKGPSGLTWAMMQSSFVMPFLMGICFFNVPCSPVRLTGLGVLLLSMFMMGKWGVTAQEGEESEKKEHSRKSVWLFFTLLAFLVAGSSQCLCNLSSYFIKESSAAGLDAIYFRAGVNSTGPFLVFLLSPLWNKNSLRGKGTLGCIIMLTICTLITVGFLFAGLDTLAACGAGAIAYPVSLGSSIAGFLVYTAIRLKERLSLPALGGVILCFAGIVLLAF